MIQQIDNRLIAFTGPEGIGKTAQAKLLVDKYKQIKDLKQKEQDGM